MVSNTVSCSTDNYSYPCNFHSNVLKLQFPLTENLSYLVQEAFHYRISIFHNAEIKSHLYCS